MSDSTSFWPLLETVNQFLFWALAGLLTVYGYFLFFHGGVPNIRTAPAIRKRIIELLRADFIEKTAQCGGSGGKDKPYTIVDLGSGNGLMTREIARALPEARVIGVEIAGQSVGWANFWKKRQHLTNLEYRKQNFLSFDFTEGDAFVMYLIPEILGALGKKIHQGARPGTLAISNKFNLGGDWAAPEIVRVKTFYLHQGLLKIYRK